MMPEFTVIENLLEWQQMIDDAPASINMRGCARFWFTVAYKLGRQVWIDGSPDITQVAIDLGGGVALVINGDASLPYPLDHDGEAEDSDVYQQLDYRFEPIENLGGMMSGIDWHDTVLGQLKAVFPPDWKIK